ncbi:Capsule polysaccharide biosynthesis protein [Pseudovibrio ascidiaceicola]|uniref:Capsule polysaccharide biosynthesis protein n=1 Tax=Pseudovibrio ascidiaceicola TaxID=285279 RepID=A0A1I4FQ29_9HYPH|nr:hypothetical protein [Pseudovibrio ascidiaceicola]SFL19450.1 Capsule polysaccharide biosynthesis protein [Pseudovibrio ascidiaceicola]
MSLRRYGFDNQDHSFWQILVVCSGQEFKDHAKEFIAFCEANSPGLRLVFLLTDQSEEARLHLKCFSENLLSTILYVLDLDVSKHKLSKEVVAYLGVEWLLRNTLLSVVLLDLKCRVVRDLTILPIEFQRTHLSFPNIQNLEDVYSPTRPMWFQASVKGAKFARALVSKLPDGCDSWSSEDHRAFLMKQLKLIAPSPNVVDFPRKYWDENAVSPYISSPHAANSHSLSLVNDLDRKPSVIVLMLRQDIETKTPFANSSSKIRVERLSKLHRMGWRYATALLADTSRQEHQNVRVIPLSLWEINDQLIARLAFAKKIFVPHKTRMQLSDPRLWFYMQEFLPLLFTTSKEGWGASALWNGSGAYSNVKVDPRLALFKTQFKKAKITKGPQRKIAEARIPSFEILVPLQMPGDEALELHANCSQEDFVAQVAEFAERRKIPILVRPHPLDRTSFYATLKERWASDYVYFRRSGHIHDLINRAQVVAVINSGVGFEAMLLEKPVMSFGKAVYDEAVTPVLGDREIDTAYDSLLREPRDKYLKRYDKFLSWYLYDIGLKLDEPMVKDRLHATADRLLENKVQSSLLEELSIGKKGLRSSRVVKKGAASSIKQVIGAITGGYDVTQNRVKKVTRKHIAQVVARAINKRLSPVLDENIFLDKRVILVGNASSLLRHKLGLFIDGHEIVIRMNLGCPYLVRSDATAAMFPKEHVYGEFTDQRSSGLEKYTVLSPDAPQSTLEKHTAIQATGSKTDIWSCSTADQSRQHFFANAFPGALPVACHSSLHFLSHKFIMRHEVKRLEGSITGELRRRLKSEPTSGLIWIEYLSKQQFSELSLVGFDFFQSGHTIRAAPGSMDAAGRSRHKPQIERNYVINSILSQDPRIKLVQYENTHLAPKREAGLKAYHIESA